MGGLDLDMEGEPRPRPQGNSGTFGREPFQSNRDFQVWRYHVSHQNLLLRSTITLELKTRIDINFGYVKFMALRNVYHGLEVRVGSSDEISEIEHRYDQKIDEGGLFVLGPNLASFVVAGLMQWHESDWGDSEPSVYGPHLG
jgi:hypothetical protein